MHACEFKACSELRCEQMLLCAMCKTDVPHLHSQRRFGGGMTECLLWVWDEVFSK